MSIVSWRNVFRRYVHIVLFAVVLVSISLAHAVSAQTVLHQASSCSLVKGKAYRTPMVQTVFLVTQECTKRPFFNPDVYLSYFKDWSNVIFIEQPDMDRIPDDALRFLPWGPLRTFGNGSLVKVTSDPKVYLILDQKAYPFEDEASFKSFGFRFDQIEDVAGATMQHFVKQTVTLNDKVEIPESLVFKYLEDPKVYLIKREGDVLVKSHILSMEDVNRIFRADRIAVLPSDKNVPNGADIGTATSQNSSADSSNQSSEPTSGTPSSGDMISINLPSGTSTVIGTLRLQATALNNASVSSVRFIIGTTVVGVATSSLNSVLVDTTRFLNTPHILTVTATDISGRTFSLTRMLLMNNVSIGGGGGGSSGGGGGSGGGGSPSPSDTTAPVVTAFTIPANSASLSVPITSLVATDAIGVTGYLINESATAPSASAGGWSASAPTTYVFSSSGSKILYAWAKDTAGNVSTSLTNSVIITLSDTTPPVISSVASSTSMTTATITWTTNESSTSTVSYGLTTGYGSTSSSALSVTSHSINLTGLTANTLYHFRVGSQDASGNYATSNDCTLRTIAVPDTTPPVISVVASSTSATSAMITWITDETSTSTVQYGLTNSYGSTTLSSSYETEHSMTLIGLSTSTLYHFRVGSQDALGNATTSADYVFRTTASTTRSDLGINIGWPTDWVQDRVFADLIRTSRTWMYTAAETNWEEVNLPASDLDAQGWPTRDARIGVLNNYAMQGTYGLYFTGRATNIYLESTDGSITDIVYTTSTNRTSAKVNLTNSGVIVVVLEFSGTQGGVRDVKLMRPTFPGASTSLPEGTLLSNEFMLAVEPFSSIRYMNFLSTNSNLQRTWSDRIPGNYATNNIDRTGYQEGVGGSWEDIIKISNQLHKDAWIDIPSEANDDYIQNVATLFLSGNASTGNRGLDADLHLYIEYSNEVWNGGYPFLQNGYNHDAAVAEVNAGDPMNLRYDGTTNDWVWAGRRVGQRIAQISDIFRGVFGDAAMHTRIRPVLAWQSQFVGGTGDPPLTYLEANQLPRNATSTALFPHPVSYYLYGGGGSAYYSRATADDPGLTLENVWNSGTMSTTTFMGESNNSILCSMFGLHRVAYEGGPSMDKINVTSTDAVLEAMWKDPRMTTAMIEHHEAWNSMGGELLMYFTLTHDFQWGILEDVTDLTHPKYLAIKALETQSPTAISIGHTIGELVPANLYDYTYTGRSTSWYPDDRLTFRHWNDGEWYGMTFNVTSTGSYESAVVYSGSGVGTLTVLVDGISVGSQSMSGSAGTLVGTPVQLSPGLHSVRARGLGPVGTPADSDLFEIRTITLRRS